METKQILKVLVGSRAHGTFTESSDFDYRGVFVVPTKQFFKLGSKGPKSTSWIEGEGSNKEDATSWEVGHFLDLAIHCNPSILEVFVAPVVIGESIEDAHRYHDWGKSLRDLFPHIWHPKRVADSFIGYGLNNRKKFLDGKDNKPNKYACSYLRVLYQGAYLLEHGILPVNLTTHSTVFPTLLAWKRGEYTTGEVVDTCIALEKKIKILAESHKHEPNLDIPEQFLLDIREAFWK